MSGKCVDHAEGNAHTIGIKTWKPFERLFLLGVFPFKDLLWEKCVLNRGLFPQTHSHPNLRLAL